MRQLVQAGDIVAEALRHPMTSTIDTMPDTLLAEVEEAIAAYAADETAER